MPHPWMHGALLASVLLLATACQSTRSPSGNAPTAPWHHIEPGMTTADVQRVAGPPRRTIPSGPTVQWMEYGTAAERVWVYVDDDVVVAAPSPRP